MPPSPRARGVGGGVGGGAPTSALPHTAGAAAAPPLPPADAPPPPVDWDEVARALADAPAELRDPKFYPLKAVVEILASADPAPAVAELRATEARLSALVDATVRRHHAGFARSLQNYASVLSTFEDARAQVDGLRASLAEAGRQLASSGRHLSLQWRRAASLDASLRLLRDARRATAAPAAVDAALARGDWRGAVRALGEGCALLTRGDLLRVGALRRLRADMLSVSRLVQARLMDEMHARVYSGGGGNGGAVSAADGGGERARGGDEDEDAAAALRERGSGGSGAGSGGAPTQPSPSASATTTATADLVSSLAQLGALNEAKAFLRLSARARLRGLMVGALSEFERAERAAAGATAAKAAAAAPALMALSTALGGDGLGLGLQQQGQGQQGQQQGQGQQGQQQQQASASLRAASGAAARLVGAVLAALLRALSNLSALLREVAAAGATAAISTTSAAVALRRLRRVQRRALELEAEAAAAARQGGGGGGGGGGIGGPLGLGRRSRSAGASGPQASDLSPAEWEARELALAADAGGEGGGGGGCDGDGGAAAAGASAAPSSPSAAAVAIAIDPVYYLRCELVATWHEAQVEVAHLLAEVLRAPLRLGGPPAGVSLGVAGLPASVGFSAPPGEPGAAGGPGAVAGGLARSAAAWMSEVSSDLGDRARAALAQQQQQQQQPGSPLAGGGVAASGGGSPSRLEFSFEHAIGGLDTSQLYAAAEQGGGATAAALCGLEDASLGADGGEDSGEDRGGGGGGGGGGRKVRNSCKGGRDQNAAELQQRGAAARTRQGGAHQSNALGPAVVSALGVAAGAAAGWGGGGGGGGGDTTFAGGPLLAPAVCGPVVGFVESAMAVLEARALPPSAGAAAPRVQAPAPPPPPPKRPGSAAASAAAAAAAALPPVQEWITRSLRDAMAAEFLPRVWADLRGRCSAVLEDPEALRPPAPGGAGAGDDACDGAGDGEAPAFASRQGGGRAVMPAAAFAATAARELAAWARALAAFPAAAGALAAVADSVLGRRLLDGALLPALARCLAGSAAGRLAARQDLAAAMAAEPDAPLLGDPMAFFVARGGAGALSAVGGDGVVDEGCAFLARRSAAGGGGGGGGSSGAAAAAEVQQRVLRAVFDARPRSASAILSAGGGPARLAELAALAEGLDRAASALAGAAGAPLGAGGVPVGAAALRLRSQQQQQRQQQQQQQQRHQRRRDERDDDEEGERDPLAPLAAALAALADRYRAAAGLAWRAARLDLLLAAAHHVSALSGASHVLGSPEDAREVPACVGALARVARRAAEGAGVHASAVRAAYILRPLPAAAPLFATWLLPELRAVNAAGAERIMRTLALAQAPLLGLAAAAAAAGDAQAAGADPIAAAAAAAAAAVSAASATTALIAVAAASGGEYTSGTDSLLTLLSGGGGGGGGGVDSFGGGLDDAPAARRSLSRARGYFSLVGAPAEDVLRLTRERPRLYTPREWEALLAVPFPGRPPAGADDLAALREAVSVPFLEAAGGGDGAEQGGAASRAAAGSPKPAAAAVERLREGVGRLRMQFGKGQASADE